MSAKKPATPSDVITVTFGDGTQREIKMTFGLLNRMAQLIGDIDNVMMVNVDPALQEMVLLEVLAIRDKDGLIQKKGDLDEYDLTTEQYMQILEWVADHLVGFMLKSLEKTKALRDRHEKTINSLMSSSTGSAT